MKSEATAESLMPVSRDQSSKWMPGRVYCTNLSSAVSARPGVWNRDRTPDAQPGTTAGHRGKRGRSGALQTPDREC